MAASDNLKHADFPLAMEITATGSAQSPHDTSIAQGSDGNIYMLACADRSGSSRFRAKLKAMENQPDAAAAARVPDCNGVTLVPGTEYRARWSKGSLKLLVTPSDEKGPKAKEATFTVINSRRMTVEENRQCQVCSLAREQ